MLGELSEKLEKEDMKNCRRNMKGPMGIPGVHAPDDGNCN